MGASWVSSLTLYRAGRRGGSSTLLQIWVLAPGVSASSPTCPWFQPQQQSEQDPEDILGHHCGVPDSEGQIQLTSAETLAELEGDGHRELSGAFGLCQSPEVNDTAAACGVVGGG